MVFGVLDKRAEFFLLAGIVIALLGWLSLVGTIPLSNIGGVVLLYVWFIALGAVYFWFAQDINKGFSLVWVLLLAGGSWFVVNSGMGWLYWVLFGGLIGLALWGRKL